MGVPRCQMLGVLEVLGALDIQILGLLGAGGGHVWGSECAECAQVQGAGSAGGAACAEWVQLLCSDGDAVLHLQWVQVVVSQLSQVVPLLNPVPDLLQPPLEGPDEPPGFCLCEPLLWVLSQEPLSREGEDRDMDPSASTPWCRSGVLWHLGRYGAMVAVPQAW